MASHKYDYFFKIFLIGDSGTDKTPLALRFIDDSATANNLTTIVK